MEAVELPDQFMAKMYGWQKEYNLPKDSLPLFIALWEKKHGSDPNLLTRMMRGSPKNHKIALDLLYELTEMASKTDGSMAIKELMQNCREILNATYDALVTVDYFPFMKLPLELRRQVYEHYIANLSFRRYPPVIKSHMMPNCNCMPIWLETRKYLDPKPFDIRFGFTSRIIKDEFFATWFQSGQFQFLCGCQLQEHLANSTLRNNINNIFLQWSGTQSDKVFKRLRKLPMLQELTIVVSEQTTKTKSKREREWDKHFKARITRRLTDSCGFDELVELALHFDPDKFWITHFFNQSEIRAKASIEALQNYIERKRETVKPSAPPKLDITPNMG